MEGGSGPLAEDRIRQGLRCLFVGLLDDVGVEVRGGGGPGVAQALGDGDDIGPAVDQQGGHGVPEGVGIDVREVVALGETVEPGPDAVRVHGPSVIPDEDVAGVLPAVSVCQLELQVGAAILPEQGDGLCGEGDLANIIDIHSVFPHKAITTNSAISKLQHF